MKKLILIAGLGFGLAGCSTAQQGDAAACAAALFATGAIDAATLAFTAATTPACIALGSDVIRTVVNDVSMKQIAARRAR